MERLSLQRQGLADRLLPGHSALTFSAAAGQEIG